MWRLIRVTKRTLRHEPSIAVRSQRVGKPGNEVFDQISFTAFIILIHSNTCVHHPAVPGYPLIRNNVYPTLRSMLDRSLRPCVETLFVSIMKRRGRPLVCLLK